MRPPLSIPAVTFLLALLPAAPGCAPQLSATSAQPAVIVVATPQSATSLADPSDEVTPEEPEPLSDSTPDQPAPEIDSGSDRYRRPLLGGRAHRPRAPISGSPIQSYAPLIRKIIREKMAGVRQCYERARQRNPALTRVPQTSFTFGADGTMSVSIPGEPALEACLKGELGGVRFPPQSIGP